MDTIFMKHQKRESGMAVEFIRTDRDTSHLLPPSVQDYLSESHFEVSSLRWSNSRTCTLDYWTISDFRKCFPNELEGQFVENLRVGHGPSGW